MFLNKAKGQNWPTFPPNRQNFVARAPLGLFEGCFGRAPRRQISNFKVQEAECFCCSNQHQHPQTGEEMICDRELVYESLEQLYPRGTSDAAREPKTMIDYHHLAIINH